MHDFSFRSSCDLSESVHELLLKASARKRDRVPTDRFTIPPAALGCLESGAQRMYHGLIEENSGAPLDDRVERAASAERHHRSAEGHGFERGDAEVFDSRKNQRPGAGKVVEDHLSRYGSEERNVG